MAEIETLPEMHHIPNRNFVYLTKSKKRVTINIYIYIYILKRAVIFISLYKSQNNNYHNPHTINENPPTFPINNMIFLHSHSGPGSSVGIATGYGLDGPGI